MAVQAGNVSQLEVGSLGIVGNEAVCIGRDKAGVYAMTLTCTHAGCDMGRPGVGTVSAQGLVCGCHGSEFDADGNVTRWPATQPLDHFAVTVDASGNLTIHGDQDRRRRSAPDRVNVLPATQTRGDPGQREAAPPQGQGTGRICRK